MPFSSLPILLTAILAFHAVFGGSGGMVILCLGGGHQHISVEAEHCESECSHDTWWPFPAPAGGHEHDCVCTDVELAILELLTLPRSDDGGKVLQAIVISPAWGLVIAEAGLGRRGPPMPPPWFDPGGAHRLAILSSIRLII